MKLGTNNKELRATTAVKAALLRVPELDPTGIAEGDRGPSFDGSVIVKRDQTKEGIASVPVQVKYCSTQSKDTLAQDDAKYSRLSMIDLENYLTSNGVIFFVVLGYEDQTAVYYDDLLPVKIRSIQLHNAGKKTTTIRLKRLPENACAIKEIFVNHVVDSQKQSSFSRCPLWHMEDHQGEIEGITTSFVGYGSSPSDALSHWVGRETYSYATVRGCPVPIPLADFGQIVGVSQIRPVGVAIDGRSYYDSVNVPLGRKSLDIDIGESIHLSNSAEEGKIHIGIKYSGTLDQQIRDLEFIQAASATGHFAIGGWTCPFPERKELKSLNVAQQLKFLISLRRLLDSLSYKDDIDIPEKLTEPDLNVALLLITGIINCKHIGLRDQQSPVALEVAKFFGLYFVIYCVRETDGLYSIQDFTDANFIASADDVNGAQRPISKYCLMSVENLSNVSNFDPELVISSVKQIGYESANFSATVFLGLRLIEAYDTSKKEDRLDTAAEVFEWLRNDPDHHVDNSILLINQLQTEIRRRKLTTAEIAKLRRLIEGSSSQPQPITVAALILLARYDEAREAYENSLDEDGRKSLDTMPIGRLWRNLDPLAPTGTTR